ncbi:PLP-dependent transferase [Phlegmacium glaucopus]|nr:PLP-dependent transferase [Phlegmacium glaucopus]
MDTPYTKEDLYKQAPPPFGHALLKHFALDPEYINLNNGGSYGTTPKPVIEATNKLSAEIESNPDLFHRLTYQERLIEVREKLSRLIGAKRDEVVLVSNASMGVNTVLRNFNWEQGDQIFTFSTTYGSISRTVQSLSDSPPFPSHSTINLNFPTTQSKILEAFKDHLRAHPPSPNKKRLAVIDSIVSNPGVLLPWKEMVQICKDEGVWSVIDAAHSIGQEVDLDLEAAKPDFWVSNCHKWLSAKRSCAVLYVPERNQHIVKTSIPTSHTYISPVDRKTPNFVEQFAWNGTIDWAPCLTVTDALEFRQWLGGEHKINAYCHNLALEGGEILAEMWDTRVIDPTGEFTLNMVNVELPIPGNTNKNLEIHAKFMNKMLRERKAYSAHFYHDGAWWTRCSAQVWNELGDFEKIGKIWLEVCAEVIKELNLEKFGSKL